MGVDFFAKVTCDRCGRSQTVEVGTQRALDRALSEANREGGFGWERLDERAQHVGDYDARVRASKVLCRDCAEAYRAYVEDRERAEREFFGGAGE